MSRLPPLLGRPRTPSGHDVPIPEAVFHALAGVQGAVESLAKETRAGFAAQAVVNSELKAVAEKASALSIERWTNLAKALVPAVVAIVGGVVGVQKLTERSTPEPTQVYESALSSELVKCQAKPEAEQAYCVANAYQTDKIRRGGGRP